MKRLWLILLLPALLFGADSLKTYNGYSAAQLSEMTDYQTIPNTSYWNSHAYKQIQYLIERALQTSGDSSGFRYRSMYSSLRNAIYNDGFLPVSGIVIGEPNTTEYISYIDSSTVLTSNTVIDLTNSFIDWQPGHISKNSACLYGIFLAQDDSNITINGGSYYGNFDESQYTGNITSGNSYNVTLDNLNVIADSLYHWYFKITTGTGSVQVRRIDGNAATSGGLTKIYLDSTGSYALSPVPDATSDYMITPLNQFELPFLFKDVKNIRLSNFSMVDFAGYIGIVNGENTWIDNIYIDNHKGMHYTTTNGFQGYGGEWLAGNSAIVLWADNATARCRSSLYPSGGSQTNDYLSKNIFITNSTLGGYYANIYLEAESGGASPGHENVYIDNCTLLYGPMRFGGTGCTYKNIRITNCTFKKDCRWTAIDFSGVDSTAENIYVDNCTFDSVLCAIYAPSNVKNITISNCTFNNCMDYPLQFTGGSNIRVENNKFINCAKSANFYLAGFNRNLITALKDRDFSATPNWTGTNWARATDSTYLHTAGSVVSATLAYANLATTFIDSLRRVYLSFQVKSNGGAAVVGSVAAYIGTRLIATADTAETAYLGFYLTAADEGQDLKLTPTIDFNGKVDNISFTTNIRESRGWTISGNTFLNCGSGDGLDCPMYAGGLYNSVISGNKFIITDSTITHAHMPFYVVGGDSLIIINNTSTGFVSNTPTVYAVTNNVQSGNVWGFGTEEGGGTSSTFDPMIRIGNTGAAGDTSAEEANFDETKRVFVGLSGYINSYPDIYGAKIIGQSWSWGYPAAQVSYNNLLFKLLTHYPDYSDSAKALNYDGLHSMAVLTNKGLGIGFQSLNQRTTGLDNKSYLIWFDSDAVKDTLAWKYVGHDSLREGLMDSAGVMKWRNRGSASWNEFSSPIHSHSSYLNKDGSTALTGTWLAGNYAIIDQVFSARGADPYIVVTDSDVNKTYSDKATISDTSAIMIDASTTTPQITFSAANGQNGLITFNASDQLVFQNASGGYTFDYPVSVMTDMKFVGRKTATYNAAQGEVWICGDTLFWSVDGTNANFWLKTGTKTGH